MMMGNRREQHYFIVTCPIHGTATVATNQKTLDTCIQCDWERPTWKRRSKPNIIEISKKEYDKIEAKHLHQGTVIEH